MNERFTECGVRFGAQWEVVGLALFGSAFALVGLAIALGALVWGGRCLYRAVAGRDWTELAWVFCAFVIALLGVALAFMTGPMSACLWGWL